MSAVVLILAIPLLAAVLVYLLRRWPLPSVALAGLAALLLATLMWRWPSQGSIVFLGRAVRITQPLVVFGQELQLSPASQWVIGLMAVTLVAAYLGAWQVSQGRSFFPFGLILLALLSTVLLIQPSWRAPVVLVAALSFAALLVQAGRQGSTRGALRLLWLPVLAVPLFLLAAWHADQAPLDPDDMLPLQNAVQLASLGLVLLLAPWPLHGPWLSAGDDAPPLVAAWLLAALAAIAVTLLQILLTSFPWLQDASITFAQVTVRLPDVLVYGGLAGALWAGVAALVQRDLGRQWSYAAMFSYSLVLIALGLGARSSWGLTWLLLLARSVALTVSGFGLAVVRQRAGGDTSHDSVHGLGTRLPWSSAAFLLGGLSLAGLPLTVGFAGQWALVQALGSQDWLRSVLVLLGGLGLAGGFLRSQRVLLGRLDNLLVEREGRLMILLAGLGILVLVWPALFPSVWRSILSAAVAAFTIPTVGL